LLSSMSFNILVLEFKSAKRQFFPSVALDLILLQRWFAFAPIGGFIQLI